MNSSKRILIAPLNWGLGHATRCIPMINALMDHGFEPILASDGDALSILEKEFPKLTCLELPSYNISYPKNPSHFKWKILKDSPSILKAIRAEKKVTQRIIEEHQVKGIISDNRFGVRSKKIPSVFITHQLNVLSGSTSWFSSKIHQKTIRKFDECWVPDVAGTPNLSGDLGHTNRKDILVKYIGPLSRLEKNEMEVVYDLMIILSGPEPQRSILDEQLLSELSNFEGRVLFVKGKVQKEQSSIDIGNMTIFNFMNSEELGRAINQSDLILCRSGYTTIMDLAKLEKKVFFIPTPNQYEQEYLANRLHESGIAPFSNQKDFVLEKLKDVKDFSGFSTIDHKTDFGELFNLFEGK